MPVDRREPQPGAQHRVVDLDELGAIAAQERDGLAGTGAERSQPAHQLVGVGVQFMERAVAVRRDHGHAVRRVAGVDRGRHPPIDQLVVRQRHGRAW